MNQEEEEEEHFSTTGSLYLLRNYFENQEFSYAYGNFRTESKRSTSVRNAGGKNPISSKE